MIWNQWYAILESSEIKKGKLTGVVRMGERMVLWRNKQNDNYAIMPSWSEDGMLCK